jgi:hypothetical protein
VSMTIRPVEPCPNSDRNHAPGSEELPFWPRNHRCGVAIPIGRIIKKQKVLWSRNMKSDLCRCAAIQLDFFTLSMLWREYCRIEMI